MKAVCFCGSPKRKNSASAELLKAISSIFADQIEVEEVFLKGFEDFASVADAEVWVLALPVYVDGLPAHVVAFLQEALQAGAARGKRIYALVNCGFYEAFQSRHAFRMLEIWCQKAGAAFCGGAGIGAGAAAVTLRKVPWDGPEKMPVQQALEKVAHLILKGGRHPPYYTGFQISREAYQASNEKGWRLGARLSGLSPEHLSDRPE